MTSLFGSRGMELKKIPKNKFNLLTQSWNKISYEVVLNYKKKLWK